MFINESLLLKDMGFYTTSLITIRSIIVKRIIDKVI